MNWKEEGLKELGLTITDYKKMSSKEKIVIDEALTEMGH